MIRGTHRAAVWACVVAVCCCCWTLPSAAQVATLSWSAPRGCPDKAYVAAQLIARQRQPLRRDLKVRARVQRAARARYVLWLVLHADDYHAERRLESKSCSSVTDAALWLIAVALDPNLSAGPVEPVPPSAAPLTQAPPTTTVDRPAAPASTGADRSQSPSVARADGPPSAPASATETTAMAVVVTPAAPATTQPAARGAGRAPWRVDWSALPRWWRAGLFGGVWSAALPAPQASVGARLGLGLGVLYAELRGALELPREQRVADASAVRFATQDLGLALCSQWGDRVRAGPCATATALRTTGSTRGETESDEQALPWGAAGVSLELGFRPVRGLEIMLETGVQLPISARPRFTVPGVGEVAVASPVTVYARLGLGFRSTDAAREQ